MFAAFLRDFRRDFRYICKAWVIRMFYKEGGHGFSEKNVLFYCFSLLLDIFAAFLAILAVIYDIFARCW